MRKTGIFRCTVVVLSSNPADIYTKNSGGYGIHIIAFFIYRGLNKTHTLGLLFTICTCLMYMFLV
jgi:hypothetical protein